MKSPAHSAWVKLLQDYAAVLRVRLVFAPKKPRGAWVLHPNHAGLGFSQRRRAVWIGAPDLGAPTDFGDVEGVWTPHEVTHAAWPDLPLDSEAEWRSGLIPYERAWMRRLCSNTAMVEALEEYTEEGADVRCDDEVAARHKVRLYGLPNPFDPEVTP